jgi:hypothetical protein
MILAGEAAATAAIVLVSVCVLATADRTAPPPPAAAAAESAACPRARAELMRQPATASASPVAAAMLAIARPLTLAPLFECGSEGQSNSREERTQLVNIVRCVERTRARVDTRSPPPVPCWLRACARQGPRESPGTTMRRRETSRVRRKQNAPPAKSLKRRKITRGAERRGSVISDWTCCCICDTRGLTLVDTASERSFTLSHTHSPLTNTTR